MAHRIFDITSSRRKFLKSLAIAGAGTLLPRNGLLSKAAQTAQAGAGRIDVHHHMIPPFYVKAMGAGRAASTATAEWSPAVSLDLMDHNGVSTAMLSVTQGVAGESMSDRSERARNLARQNNEYGAEVVKGNPKRFGLVRVAPATRSGRQPEGNRALARHAQSRRHRSLEHLWRQVGGRSRIRRGFR